MFSPKDDIWRKFRISGILLEKSMDLGIKIEVMKDFPISFVFCEMGLFFEVLFFRFYFCVISASWVGFCLLWH